MVKRTLKTRIILSFLSIILLLSVCIALLGIYVIDRDINERAQQKVRTDIVAARTVYQAEIDRIGQVLRLVDFEGDFEQLRQKMGLDYLSIAQRDQIDDIQSSIVLAAFEQADDVGGTRVISAEEIRQIDQQLTLRVRIPIEPTERARPDIDKSVVQSAMAKEYALPIEYTDGQVSRVAFGGRIVNRDNEFVDMIRGLVYGQQYYNGTPAGTVTIFLDDVRIATNVLGRQRQRAIGTRVSAEVYEKVVLQGQSWLDRAFVVGDSYKAAYEPIRDIDDNVIGILYVGMLEAPFRDTSRNLLLGFLATVGGATALGILLSFILAGGISRPLTSMLDATKKLSTGEFDYEVYTHTGIDELNRLAESFNDMSTKLDDRQRSLHEANEKLVESNKQYIELIGFVSHELKGILASAIINAYSVRDGLLGMVNFKQRKALDSVTRNLDYLDATVKKFLNLGRIERGDLAVRKMPLKLRELFEDSLGSMATLARKRDLNIANDIDPDLEVSADSDLLLIVANNLLSNAIKYGLDKGKIEIKAQIRDSKTRISIYNDSVPITAEQAEHLFQKFYRIDTVENKRIKGTGLGLYITRQIIESHGGKIWVEPTENGNTFIFEIERDA